MKTYGLIKAAIPAELGRRVNRVMKFEIAQGRDAGTELQRLAERFCALQGWMMISLRPLSEDEGQRQIEAQKSDSAA